MRHLIAAREFVYAGRRIGACQVFDAVTDEDARTLTLVGLASPMPNDDDPDPDPDPEPDEPDPEPNALPRRRGRPRKDVS